LTIVYDGDGNRGTTNSGNLARSRFKAADAAVAGSAIKEGIPLLTRDSPLINFLTAVGQAVETF